MNRYMDTVRIILQLVGIAGLGVTCYKLGQHSVHEKQKKLMLGLVTTLTNRLKERNEHKNAVYIEAECLSWEKFIKVADQKEKVIFIRECYIYDLPQRFKGIDEVNDFLRSRTWKTKFLDVNHNFFDIGKGEINVTE